MIFSPEANDTSPFRCRLCWSDFHLAILGLHRGPSAGTHYHPQNPLLVSEDIFNVIFVVAGLVMLVIPFRAKIIDGSARFGLWSHKRKKSPIGWPAERSFYMPSAACDPGRSILFLNLPWKRLKTPRSHLQHHLHPHPVSWSKI